MYLKCNLMDGYIMGPFDGQDMIDTRYDMELDKVRI
jgi:hypothetical protein